MNASATSRATREVPLRVGLTVAGAAALALLGLFGVATALIWRASREDAGGEWAEEWEPERGHGSRKHFDRGPEWQDRVIDLGDVVPVLVVLALVSVVFVGFVAWWVTRRANEPMERALAMQRRFVADASHELRTPLTTLNSRIQLAQLRLEKDGDVAPVLAEMRRDADALDGLLTDLLVTAEAEPVAQAQSRCSVEEACAEAIRLTAESAQQHQIRLVFQAAPGLTARAEKMSLVRALVALIDNAVGHSPAGSTVTVTAAPAAGHGPKRVAIRVADQGSGIDDPNPERLFQRFARGRSATSRPGSGLGLALVRETAVRFGGTVAIETTGPEGSTFLLVLPS